MKCAASGVDNKFFPVPFSGSRGVRKSQKYKIMKRLLACLLLAVATSSRAAEAEWLTDYQAALNRAGTEHKLVLLDFTGSDWCSWCKKLKAEVFDQPEFAAFASENLVLVEVDFPRQKRLSADQKAANDGLARNFNIQGYPTIIIVDAAGNKVGQAGYMPGGPKAFIEHLEKIPGMKHVEGVAKADEPEAPHRPPPVYTPIPASKPTYYPELAVKVISGAPGNRVALINNQTFMVGESARVHVRDTKVLVVCKDIREDSVLVTFDGKPAELKLGQKFVPSPVQAHTPPPAPAPAPQVRLFSYAGLTLKDIIEVKGGRIARINNLSLVVGETRTLKAGSTSVEVLCKEIHKDSVLITVDGKLVELKLAAKSPAQGGDKVAQN